MEALIQSNTLIKVLMKLYFNSNFGETFELTWCIWAEIRDFSNSN